MKINEILGLSSKDKSTRIQPEGQKLMIKAGYAQLVESKSSLEIKLLPLGMKLLDNLICSIEDLIPEYSEVDSNLSENDLNAILTSHLPSYKYLPSLLYNLSSMNYDSYSASKGLFYPKKSKVLNLYQILQEDNYSKVDKFNQNIAELLSKLKVNTKTIGQVNSNIAKPFSIIYPSDMIGEEEYLICDKCDYSASVSVALFDKYPGSHRTDEELKDLSGVETPNCTTIEELAELLSIQKSRTAKIVFYRAEINNVVKLLICVIRGDMELNESKLRLLVKIDEIEIADDELIKSVGAFPGYASPIGIDHEDVIVVVDDLITSSVNLVAGANKQGLHMLNTNYGRDYSAEFVGDIALAKEGDSCHKCKEGTLIYLRGVELITIENKSSDFEVLNYIGKNGKPSKYHIINIQIDLYKIIASIIETNLDENGMILPSIIAPYEVIIIQLSRKEEVIGIVHQVNEILTNKFRVILDDRKERPGVKFADADLMGFPLKIIISDKTITNNQLELKFRDGTVITLPTDKLKESMITTIKEIVYL